MVQWHSQQDLQSAIEELNLICQHEGDYTNGTKNIQQKLFTMRHVIVMAPDNALSSRRRNSPKALSTWNSTYHLNHNFHRQETNLQRNLWRFYFSLGHMITRSLESWRVQNISCASLTHCLVSTNIIMCDNIWQNHSSNVSMVKTWNI